MSLRLRITLVLLLGSTLVLGLLGLVADRALAARLGEQRRQAVETDLARLARSLQEPVWTVDLPQVREVLLAELAGADTAAWIAIGIDGRWLVAERTAGAIAVREATEPAAPAARRDLVRDGDPPRVVGTILLAPDTAPIDAELARRRWEILGAILILDAALAGFAWLVLGGMVEQRLRPLAHRLEEVLDAISDGVLTTTTGNRIERSNPAARRLLRRDDLEGRPLGEALPAADGHGMIELHGRRVALSCGPLQGGGSVLVLRDLTDQLAAVDRMQQAQRLESIGKLAGGIAHDSNNLLTVIMGAAELLGRTVDAGARQRHVDTILDTASRAADFNRKLLAFARKEAVRRDPVDLRLLLDEVETLLGHSLDKRVTILVERPGESLATLGDRTALLNALINLGVNAGDAMAGGGELRLSLMRTDLVAPEEAAGGGELPAGAYACLLVADTGSGIPAAVLPRLFEPFFTTKPVGKGTGLGLAAVLGTVRSHGGTVTVSSQTGRGTTFRVLLPLTKLPEGVASGPAIPGRWRGSGTVLLVDDDATVRLVAQRLLEEMGFTVLTAANGKLALEAHERHRAEIRLVVLDMVMPVMDGETCFRELRARDAKLPVLFVSGFSGDADLARLRAIGTTDWLAKPFRAEQLVAAVRQTLERR